jgi:hypothetical protein
MEYTPREYTWHELNHYAPCLGVDAYSYKPHQSLDLCARLRSALAANLPLTRPDIYDTRPKRVVRAAVPRCPPKPAVPDADVVLVDAPDEEHEPRSALPARQTLKQLHRIDAGDITCTSDTDDDELVVPEVFTEQDIEQMILQYHTRRRARRRPSSPTYSDSCDEGDDLD